MKSILATATAGFVLATSAVHAAEPKSGAELYANHCAACHGAEGEGGGPVAAVMQVTVPNLRTLRMRNRGVFPADAIAAYVDGREIKASHGDRQMPIWGDVFRAEQPAGGDAAVRARIAAIVAFIEALQYR